MSSPTAIPASRRAAKRIAIAIDDVRSSKETAQGHVVLAYHRVGGRTVSPVDLPTSWFRQQMAHLRAAATVSSLDDVVTDLSTSESTTRQIAVTVDDGTADFVDIALPILVDYQIPVTLYLATGPVDSGARYPADGVPISWCGLRDALTTGLVTIGAHTHNHVLLDRCDPKLAAIELDTCSARIEDELGVTPTHFAYPKAVPAHGEIDRLIRDRYTTAAVAGTRPNIHGRSDLHRLYRSPIQNADGWDGFVRKVEGGMGTEDDIRRVINLLRYRGKST